MPRKYISADQLGRTDWKAYKALDTSNDLTETCECTDLVLYYHEGELYAESQDEQTLHVWRDGVLVELDFNDRPL